MNSDLFAFKHILFIYLFIMLVYIHKCAKNVIKIAIYKIFFNVRKIVNSIVYNLKNIVLMKIFKYILHKIVSCYKML